MVACGSWAVAEEWSVDCDAGPRTVHTSKPRVRRKNIDSITPTAAEAIEGALVVLTVSCSSLITVSSYCLISPYRVLVSYHCRIVLSFRLAVSYHCFDCLIPLSRLSLRAWRYCPTVPPIRWWRLYCCDGHTLLCRILTICSGVSPETFC